MKPPVMPSSSTNKTVHARTVACLSCNRLSHLCRSTAPAPFRNKFCSCLDYSVISSESSRLDAAQGSSEERASRINDTTSERKSVIDAVMRQEFWQSLVLCTKAGQNGGGI